MSGELDAIWSSGSAQARAAALSSGDRNWRKIARILGLPAASLRSFTSIFPHLILRCKYLTFAPKEEKECKSQRVKGMNPGLVSPFLQLLNPFLVPSIKEYVKKGKVWKEGQQLFTVCFVFCYPWNPSYLSLTVMEPFKNRLLVLGVWEGRRPDIIVRYVNYCALYGCLHYSPGCDICCLLRGFFFWFFVFLNQVLKFLRAKEVYKWY